MVRLTNEKQQVKISIMKYGWRYQSQWWYQFLTGK
jgi:hypothetical protein